MKKSTQICVACFLDNKNDNIENNEYRHFVVFNLLILDRYADDRLYIQNVSVSNKETCLFEYRNITIFV